MRDRIFRRGQYWNGISHRELCHNVLGYIAVMGACFCYILSIAARTQLRSPPRI